MVHNVNYTWYTWYAMVFANSLLVNENDSSVSRSFYSCLVPKNNSGRCTKALKTKYKFSPHLCLLQACLSIRHCPRTLLELKVSITILHILHFPIFFSMFAKSVFWCRFPSQKSKESKALEENSGQYKAFIFHLHQKINCLVAGKVINYMAVKELCLLCRHLIVDKWLYVYSVCVWVCVMEMLTL